jgi:O-antigen/teichoic acid export membrane protein
MPENGSVVQKAIASVKWAALMEIVPQVAAPIVFVILARLLAPEDFGVVATAMIAISLAQRLWDAGLGSALVQTQQAPKRAANVVFWTNLVLGVVIYLLLFLFAPWLASFFDSPRTMPVLRVLGLQIVIASLGSVPQALLERDLGYRQLFWVRLATSLVPALFSIPLAFFGYGVWALVAGSLAGSLLNALLLWRRSSWRPRLDYDVRLARGLYVFGAWAIGESLAAWFIVWGDNLIVGRYLGVEELGVYQIGWKAVTLLFGFVLLPFLTVLYPTFSRMQGAPDALRTTFSKVNRLVISIALPMGVGLLLTGSELVSVFFGNSWRGLGLFLSVIGFTHGISWLVGINPELYRAIGRPDLNTKLMLISILYRLPIYLIAAPLGLEMFVIVRAGVTLVDFPLHVYLASRVIGVSPAYLWHEGKSMILSTMVMTGVLIGVKTGIHFKLATIPDAAVLILLVGLGIGVYVVMLWFLSRPFVVQTIGLIRRASSV